MTQRMYCIQNTGIICWLFLFGETALKSIFFSFLSDRLRGFNTIFLLYRSASQIKLSSLIRTAPDLSKGNILPCVFCNASTPMHLALGLNPSFRATDFYRYTRRNVLNSSVPVCVCVCNEKQNLQALGMAKWRPLSHLLRLALETYGAAFGRTPVLSPLIKTDWLSGLIIKPSCPLLYCLLLSASSRNLYCLSLFCLHLFQIFWTLYSLLPHK